MKVSFQKQQIKYIENKMKKNKILLYPFDLSIL